MATFAPALIIFDKDGTLIDVHTMWGGWATELARRLEDASGLPIAGPLFKLLGFDPLRERVAPDGHLALTPAPELRALIVDLLRGAGLSRQAAEEALAAGWHIPDPVALARPMADLRALFKTIRAHGAKIAVATADDRPLTEAILAGLGISSLVDGLACADDGLPLKPAPDMVLHLCRQLEVPPARSAVVGDHVVDLQMGRSAGAGLVIGVSSGLSAASGLAMYADLVLSSIEELPARFGYTSK